MFWLQGEIGLPGPPGHDGEKVRTLPDKPLKIIFAPGGEDTEGSGREPCGEGRGEGRPASGSPAEPHCWPQGEPGQPTLGWAAAPQIPTGSWTGSLPGPIKRQRAESFVPSPSPRHSSLFLPLVSPSVHLIVLLIFSRGTSRQTRRCGPSWSPRPPRKGWACRSEGRRWPSGEPRREGGERGDGAARPTGECQGPPSRMWLCAVTAAAGNRSWELGTGRSPVFPSSFTL